MATPSTSAGMMTSRPRHTAVSSFQWSLAPLKRKKAPSRNSISGLAALPMSRRKLTMGEGSLSPATRARMPSTLPTISGFLAMSRASFFPLGFLPL